MRIFLKYIVVLLIWSFIIFFISNGIISVDTMITVITLSGLALQNLKIKEIIQLQDWLISKITLYDFFRFSLHIFMTIAFIAILIRPIALNEFPNYLIKYGELSEWDSVFRSIIAVFLPYSVILYILSFVGKDIDKQTQDGLNKKYGLFYIIALVIYVAGKLTHSR